MLSSCFNTTTVINFIDFGTFCCSHLSFDMASHKLAVIVCTLLVLALESALAINCKGCTPLDTLSFDKLLSKFKVSLIKFDVAYPYGDKHEEFAKFSASAAQTRDLLVGEVGIKDYGDKDNADLAERFGVAKDDYPVVILFAHDDNGKLLDHRYTLQPNSSKTR